MAEKVLVELIDDIDGSEAHESITFSLDVVGYEIDLSDKTPLNDVTRLHSLLSMVGELADARRGVDQLDEEFLREIPRGQRLNNPIAGRATTGLGNSGYQATGDRLLVLVRIIERLARSLVSS